MINAASSSLQTAQKLALCPLLSTFLAASRHTRSGLGRKRNDRGSRNLAQEPPAADRRPFQRDEEHSTEHDPK
ncbi:MAG: hypothetical protein ACREF0_21760, partial [Acetobacteraceae bacterium]